MLGVGCVTFVVSVFDSVSEMSKPTVEALSASEDTDVTSEITVKSASSLLFLSEEIVEETRVAAVISVKTGLLPSELEELESTSCSETVLASNSGTLLTDASSKTSENA